MRTIHRHIRGNVVGYIALFVALGGTAWALGANSVGSRQIKGDAVRSRHIKDGQVKMADLADPRAFAQAGSGHVFVDAVNYATSTQGNQSTQVFSRGGLSLYGQCLVGGALNVYANTSVDNSTITSHYGQVSNASSLTDSKPDFDSGATFHVVLFVSNGDSTSGTLVYTNPASNHVVLTWQANDEQGLDGSPLGGTQRCLFSGVATTVLAP